MMRDDWKLETDPFAEVRASYLPTRGHDDVIAAILAALASHQRRVVLVGEAGAGKSVVAAEVANRLRGPLRRVARCVAPLDGTSLMNDLACDLGWRIPATTTRASAWRMLIDATRVCRLQGLSLLLVVDAAESLSDSIALADLERLESLGDVTSTEVAILEVRRSGTEQFAINGDRLARSLPLAPLTRSDTQAYLAGCLTRAGGAGDLFTPRAVTRLHALSGGLPRCLNRLASLALREGARRGVERIDHDLVEQVSPAESLMTIWR